MRNVINQILIFVGFLKENEELTSTEEKEGCPDMMCLYDPSFLIPLFSYIVRPGKNDLNTAIHKS